MMNGDTAPKKRMLTVLCSILTYYITVTFGEVRWCKISNTSSVLSKESWMKYNDSMQTCFTCSSQTIIIDANQVANFECCGGTIVRAGTCNIRLKESGQVCSNAMECDGTKQCAQGLDEYGCGSCNTTQFACRAEQMSSGSNAGGPHCIDPSEVCDSKKHCIDGSDESGCQWHEGWCNGFLCKSPNERCIPLEQVCDGTKQCIDGSDEFNCEYCDNQFRCLVFVRNDSEVSSRTNTETAQCIGSFRVCDGERNCENNLDETNCYRWREWSRWSECSPPAVCNRTRTRTCVNGFTSEDVDVTRCYDVEDYHETSRVRLLDSHTELCPTCVPTTTSTVTTTTTTTTTEITTEADLTTQFPTSTVVPTTDNMSTTQEIVSTSTEHDSVFTTAGQISTETKPQPTQTASKTVEVSTKLTTTLQTVNTPTPHADHQLSSQNINTSSNGSRGVSTSPSNTTRAEEEISSASAALAVIIAASIVAGALLLVMVFCLVFCFTEKRYKTGKWTPRKLRKNQTIKVPDMYYDIPISNNGTLEKNLPTRQQAAEHHMMSSFSGVNNTIDSGIDANSTSSGEADHHHHHEHHRTTHFMNSPFPDRRMENNSIAEEQVFPPPPPLVT